MSHFSCTYRVWGVDHPFAALGFPFALILSTHLLLLISFRSQELFFFLLHFAVLLIHFFFSPPFSFMPRAIRYRLLTHSKRKTIQSWSTPWHLCLSKSSQSQTRFFLSCYEKSQWQKRERRQQALHARKSILAAQHKAAHNYTAGTPQEICQIRIYVQFHLLVFVCVCAPDVTFQVVPERKNKTKRTILGTWRNANQQHSSNVNAKKTQFLHFLLASLSC